MINSAYLTCLFITIRSRLSVPALVAQTHYGHYQSAEQHYVPYSLFHHSCSNVSVLKRNVV